MNTQRHRLEWVSPSPLWPTGAVPTSASMRQPALLSFKSDQFVTELTTALGQSPPTLPVAEWESNAVPPAGVPRLSSPPWSPSPGSPPAPLKLFQPVHGRFYMVAASFVCQQYGLPDHSLDVANQERVYFVLRKLSADQKTEMAWVPNPAAPTDPTQHTWQPVTHPKSLAANEELNPLFPVFVPGTTPLRRIHAGLIPTSSRETLSAAATAASPPANIEADPRVLEARARVLDPFGAIVNAVKPPNPPAGPSNPAMPLLVDSSAFLMLDFAEILEKYAPDAFDALMQRPDAPTPTPESAALITALETAVADTTTAPPQLTWAGALRAAFQAGAAINAPGSPPSPLTTPTFNLAFNDGTLLPDTQGDGTPNVAMPGASNLLSALLEAAIVSESQPYDPPDAAIASAFVPKVDSNALYVIRCVFQRCALKRQYSALFPAILSDKSETFALASFFDADAPARNIRIPMPFDTSPAGLRKFPKGVGFLLSPQLQQQINQVSNIKNVINGQLGSGGIGFGEICCFSIQILVIISLMLTFMIAIMLNLVFWWLPFLKICFPVPDAVIAAASGSEDSSS
jgi:hypothetical protein